MFKKLKDKLAEEVKSSPQRIQQFAQAAQAAVTSASSSISDITNNDLFSIGDNDSQQSRSTKTPTSPSSPSSTFQDVSLGQPSLQTSTESMDFASSHDIVESQRQRRLSNSSFASDVSFRLPNYESPSMYHLQSDVEISASEAEERGFSSGAVSLDRVTKEQIYAAYRRTQERYKKYRSQYADLARHYKLLERENAKARSVLVETQDKALRRISELREQCSLEQSAKAHLEKALRIELEERNMKIDTLNTKIQFLNNNENKDTVDFDHLNKNVNDNDTQLINLETEDENKHTNDESLTSEIVVLNNKIEKLEQLVNKYKDSLKTTKEKNAQITTEIQILSNELENKNKENEQLKVTTSHLTEARQKIQELNDINEELQNKINAYDFTKTKEISTLEFDLHKSQEEIAQLQSKIEVFIKREEENAISLAENKLSIHKELESKETEIKSLKDSLSASKKEIESLNIIISDCKSAITVLEEERSRNSSSMNEVTVIKTRITDLESQIQELTQKCHTLENLKTKADEDYKCLQLQLKQETAEKLAMIDRNVYLENRNTQLSEENGKKSSQISNLEIELKTVKKEKDSRNVTELETSEKNKMLEEITLWKDKYSNLESEIQEEREELVKLQTEIEKLLANYELIQTQNTELHTLISSIKSENVELHEKVKKSYKVAKTCEGLIGKVKDLKQMITMTSQETKSLKDMNNNAILAFKDDINHILGNSPQKGELDAIINKYETLKKDYLALKAELNTTSEQCFNITSELHLVRKENSEIRTGFQRNQEEHVNTKNKLESLSHEHKITLEELKSTQNENSNLLENIKITDSKCLSLQAAMDSSKEQYSDLFKKLQELEKENEKLLKTAINVENLMKENQKLIESTKETENRCQKLQAAIDNNVEQSSIQTDEMKVLTQQNDNMIKNMKNLEKNNNNLSEKINDLENKCKNLKDVLERCEEQNSEHLNKMKALTLENEKLVKMVEVIKSLEKDNSNLLERIKESEKERQKLQEDVASNNAQSSSLTLKVEAMSLENEELLQKAKTLESLKKENEKLLKDIKHIEKMCEDLQTKIKNNEAESSDQSTEIDELKRENEILVGRVKSIESNNLSLNEEYDKALKEANIVTKNLEDRNQYIEKLEDNIKVLTQENITLKGQYETIANNVKDLESEISEVRKSHIEIEVEKNHLNSIIEQLEKNERVNKNLNIENSKSTQIDNDQFVEIDDLECKQKNLNQNNEMKPEMTKENDVNEYDTPKDEHSSLKEENRRLHSDIAGLQTYLSKISKENSILNDKMRELIASSEHGIDKNEIKSSNLREFKNEPHSGNERVDDLLRENTLLIEENLELKDQLNSQNYVNKSIDDNPTPDNRTEQEFMSLKEKYSDLLETKNKLERRLIDMEDMSKSFGGNMQQMQDNNEKLKLSNEKLERRLDEALVSLRHLHSLQENTELEYLKNILYEYLTGSGTHSVTLAKVLAAVVKFDDLQTQQVLLKEKERQGLLRQLGLL